MISCDVSVFCNSTRQGEFRNRIAASEPARSPARNPGSLGSSIESVKPVREEESVASALARLHCVQAKMLATAAIKKIAASLSLAN